MFLTPEIVKHLKRDFSGLYQRREAVLQRWRDSNSVKQVPLARSGIGLCGKGEHKKPVNTEVQPQTTYHLLIYGGEELSFTGNGLLPLSKKIY